MRGLHAIERSRRDAVRAQLAAASAYAWMRDRCERQCASRFDLLIDQDYVARSYEYARNATANVACAEHRS